MSDIDDLLDRLSADGAAPTTGHLMRFLWPLLVAVFVCAVAVSLVLDGAFASVAERGLGPMAVKWGFSLALLVLSGAALWVLGKPGRRSRWAMELLALPFVPVAALLVFELEIAGPLVYGATWARCLAAMAIMSPLAFAGAVLATRALAPTDLRRAGLAAGLFGGAVAMTAYAPFCPELGMLYMVVFYCLPIAAMAAIGYAFGPRLLRW